MEFWGLAKHIEKKIFRSELRAMERRLIQVMFRDGKLVTWIREQTCVGDIQAQIKREKWSWPGHMVQRTDRW